MLVIQCNECKAIAFAPDEQHENPDAALACECCPQGSDHDHAAHANAGNEPCRPVTITLAPGQVQLHAVGG